MICCQDSASSLSMRWLAGKVPALLTTISSPPNSRMVFSHSVFDLRRLGHVADKRKYIFGSERFFDFGEISRATTAAPCATNISTQAFDSAGGSGDDCHFTFKGRFCTRHLFQLRLLKFPVLNIENIFLERDCQPPRFSAHCQPLIVWRAMSLTTSARLRLTPNA